MLAPSLKKNDPKARVFIYTVSAVVFTAVLILSRVKLEVSLPFHVHVFATANAIINSTVALLLLLGLIAVKNKNFVLHKKIMLAAIFLSVLFLVSYIAHHLLAGDTRYGDIDHNGVLSETEKAAAGSTRTWYYLLLFTHILLAGIIFTLILYTAFMALIGE